MFNKATDKKIKGIAIGVLGTVLTLALIVIFGQNNKVTDVGYRPVQPIPFSHKLHASEENISHNGVEMKGLGIKCMYCHAQAEVSAHSPVPTTSTCMNCHVLPMQLENERGNPGPLELIRTAYEKNQPIEWVRIHKVPDYVHFNHSRHIRAQIDCKSCHGPVETMGVISQYKPLSMGWCLDCHRNPEKFIVPARPISGIYSYDYENRASIDKFIGVKANSYDPNAKATLAKMREIVSPHYGMVETADLPKPMVAGMLAPKHAQYGPENCSSCHH